jgi:hypothetical protein
MNRLGVLALMGFGLCSLGNAASTWNFGGVSPSPGQDVGANTLNLSSGGISITALGFYNLSGGADAPRDLWRKFNADPNERGLGFKDDSFGDFEIDTGGFIVLNLSDPKLANLALALSITSIQATENYAWYHGNTLDTTKAFGGLSLVATGQSFSPLTFTAGSAAGNKYIAIEASSRNVLINTLAVVPEPRFYGILLIGMLALAGMVWRKRRVAE